MLHPHKEFKHHDGILHTIFTKVVNVVALLSPLITLPQLLDIYINKNASGVSSLTWLLYIFTASMWVSYGIIHKERILIINGTLGVILAGLIFIGTLIYK